MVNPIQDDPELRSIVSRLDTIKERHQFNGWRASFLERYETFLEGSATEIATQRYQEYTAEVTALVKLILRTKTFLDKGDLNPTKSSVRARQTLSELSKQITIVITLQESLLPGTGHKEQEAGFTKNNMGAVLVRDRFSQYQRMSMCRETLRRFKKSLRNIANRQIMEELDMFGAKFQIFCDVVSDLGMRTISEKCVEIEPVPEEQDEEVDEETEALSAVEEVSNDVVESDSTAKDAMAAKSGLTLEQDDDSEVESLPEATAQNVGQIVPVAAKQSNSGKTNRPSLKLDSSDKKSKKGKKSKEHCIKSQRDAVAPGPTQESSSNKSNPKPPTNAKPIQTQEFSEGKAKDQVSKTSGTYNPTSQMDWTMEDYTPNAPEGQSKPESPSQRKLEAKNEELNAPNSRQEDFVTELDNGTDVADEDAKQGDGADVKAEEERESNPTKKETNNVVSSALESKPEGSIKNTMKETDSLESLEDESESTCGSENPKTKRGLFGHFSIGSKAKKEATEKEKSEKEATSTGESNATEASNSQSVESSDASPDDGKKKRSVLRLLSSSRKKPDARLSDSLRSGCFEESSPQQESDKKGENILRDTSELEPEKGRQNGTKLDKQYDLKTSQEDYEEKNDDNSSSDAEKEPDVSADDGKQKRGVFRLLSSSRKKPESEKSNNIRPDDVKESVPPQESDSKSEDTVTDSGEPKSEKEPKSTMDASKKGVNETRKKDSEEQSDDSSSDGTEEKMDNDIDDGDKKRGVFRVFSSSRKKPGAEKNDTHKSDCSKESRLHGDSVSEDKDALLGPSKLVSEGDPKSRTKANKKSKGERVQKNSEEDSESQKQDFDHEEASDEAQDAEAVKAKKKRGLLGLLSARKKPEIGSKNNVDMDLNEENDSEQDEVQEEEARKIGRNAEEKNHADCQKEHDQELQNTSSDNVKDAEPDAGADKGKEKWNLRRLLPSTRKRESDKKVTTDLESDNSLPKEQVSELNGDITQDPITLKKVWFQLAGEQPSQVKVKDGANVDDLKRAIRSDCPSLQNVNCGILTVYPAGGDPNTGKALESYETVPTNTTGQMPLPIVISKAPLPGGKPEHSKNEQKMKSEKQASSADAKADKTKTEAIRDGSKEKCSYHDVADNDTDDKMIQSPKPGNKSKDGTTSEHVLPQTNDKSSKDIRQLKNSEPALDEEEEDSPSPMEKKPIESREPVASTTSTSKADPKDETAKPQESTLELPRTSTEQTKPGSSDVDNYQIKKKSPDSTTQSRDKSRKAEPVQKAAQQLEDKACLSAKPEPTRQKAIAATKKKNKAHSNLNTLTTKAGASAGKPETRKKPLDKSTNFESISPVTAQGMPVDDQASNSSTPTERPRESTKKPESMRPSAVRAMSFDDDDATEAKTKPQEESSASKKTADRKSRKSESVSVDTVQGIPIDDEASKSSKSSTKRSSKGKSKKPESLRPSAVRGMSFDDDSSEPKKKPQVELNPSGKQADNKSRKLESSRAGAIRGMPIDDEASNSSKSSTKQSKGKPKKPESLRTSAVRGMSFDDDEVNTKKKPQLELNPTEKQADNKSRKLESSRSGAIHAMPIDDEASNSSQSSTKQSKGRSTKPMSLRPSAVRGMAFDDDDDDDGTELKKKPQVELNPTDKQADNKSRKLESSSPGAIRGMPVDDEASNSPKSSTKQSKLKPKKPESLRPSAVRGMSFDDDDTEPKTKPQEESSGSKMPADSNLRELESCSPGVVRGMPIDDEASKSSKSSAKQSKRKSKKPESLRPTAVRGMSFDDDDDDDDGTEQKKKAQVKLHSSEKQADNKSRKLESSRPGAIRGMPINDEASNSSKSLEKKTNKQKKKTETMRPSVMRGMPFDDDDDDDDGTEQKKKAQVKLHSSEKQADNKSRKLESSRPGAIRRMPINDEASNSSKSLEKKSNKQKKKTETMRPTVMRGMSFDDEPKKKPEVELNPSEKQADIESRKVESSRPDVVHGTPIDDEAFNASNSPEKKSKKQKKKPESMRPAIMPGHSFHEDDIQSKKKKQTESKTTETNNMFKSPETVRQEPLQGLSVNDEESTVSKSSIKKPKELTKRPEVSLDDKSTPISKSSVNEPNKQSELHQLEPSSSANFEDGNGKTESSRSDLKSNTAQNDKVQVQELDEEKRRKCYMWYARMGMPNRSCMKRRVAALPDSCDITVEDVEMLPWVGGGAMLRVSEMNKLFLEG